MEKEALLQYLKKRHTGYMNAASSRSLEVVFHVGGKPIRKAVNELRCDGHPICSDDNGYYYAETGTELNATIRQLQSRIIKIAGAKNGLVRASEQFTDNGQTNMFV